MEHWQIQCVAAVVAEDHPAGRGQMGGDDFFGQGLKIGGPVDEEAVGGVEEDQVGKLRGFFGGGEPIEQVATDDASASGDAERGDIFL